MSLVHRDGPPIVFADGGEPTRPAKGPSELDRLILWSARGERDREFNSGKKADVLMRHGLSGPDFGELVGKKIGELALERAKVTSEEVTQ